MPSQAVDEASYLDLAREAWIYVRANRRMLLSCAAAGIFAALIVAHFAPMRYQATTMVAAQEGLSKNSSLDSLGDIAGLAGGTGLPGSSFQPFERFTQTLTNNTVAKELLKQPWILPALFPKEWDSDTATWHPPGGILGPSARLLTFAIGLPSWHPPGVQELSDKLSENTKTNKFGRNPAYTISYQSNDPQTAARILMLLLKTNDQIIQHDAQIRLNATTAYLQQRLKTEAEINRRNALNQLLLEQERSLMAAEVNGPYAAKIIDQIAIDPVVTRKIIFGAIAFLVVFAATFFGLRQLNRKASVR